MIDLETHKSTEIAAPADVVWEPVADFGALADWWPPGLLEKVDIEGAGIGMVRAIHTRIGMVVRERLESLDEDEHRIEISITGDLPVGMCEYTAIGQVIPKGIGACTVDWTGRYRVPDKAAAPAAAKFVDGVYTMMFKGIRDHIRTTHGASR